MGTEPVHVAVLAGGQSRRMGRDKALLEFNGQPLIERVLAAARPLACPIFIVGDPAAYADLGPPVHRDLRPALGPIGGLHTALAAAAGPVLALACDLPFLTAGFLRLLVARRGARQAVVPVTAHGAQPLSAIYEPSCREVVERAIAARSLSMRGLLDQLDVDELREEAWGPYDESGLLFANINTPEELARVRDRALNQNPASATHNTSSSGK